MELFEIRIYAEYDHLATIQVPAAVTALEEAEAYAEKVFAPVGDLYYRVIDLAAEAEEAAYRAAEEARGLLAYCPSELECYKCDAPGVLRQVVARGPIVDRADPTQTYELACGHFAS
jgi:hypothetical protein